VVVVGLSGDNMREEGGRKGRVWKGERGFEFVDNNDGDEGRLRRRSRGLAIFSPDVVPCDGEPQTETLWFTNSGDRSSTFYNDEVRDGLGAFFLWLEKSPISRCSALSPELRII